MKKLDLKLDNNSKATKFRQLVDTITDSIRNHTLPEGEILPSVNEISNNLGIARATVFKAYSELKKLGVVDSTKAKGYYVAKSAGKIFLFLDTFSPYKDLLYNALMKKLNGLYIVDLCFHNYNEDIFETVISSSIGKYNYYVVMNFNNEKIHPVLNKIEKEKILLLDWGDVKGTSLSYVNQNFAEEPFKCLEQAASLIHKYNEFIYVNNSLSNHPPVTQKWFTKFCKKNNIKYRIETIIKADDISTGKAFFLVQHLDVVSLIKYAKFKKLIIGKDIGIICYNDSPMFEVIEKGITVISTDFAKMGELAGEYIMSKNAIQETMPTSLILRGSL